MPSDSRNAPGIKGFRLQREELPLAPYRVLDLADEKGAFCARILGDLGAEVIKIERPIGDPAQRCSAVSQKYV